jgi:hypothetical protein
MIPVIVSKPSESDIADALEEAEESQTFDRISDFSRDNFELRYVGELSVKELKRFDDIDPWLDFGIGEHDLETREEKIEALQSFRGREWASRAVRWLDTGIPPIVIVAEKDRRGYQTHIGDGRGRTNFAALFNRKLQVWMLVYRGE